MNITRLNQIVKERENLLEKMNQMVGALEELTFLYKKGHIEADLYCNRFDRITAKFKQLSNQFYKLGVEADGLRG